MKRAWLENVVIPLVVGVMVGCVALSVVELAHVIDPKWNATYLLAGCVLTALEANYSYRLLQREEWRGTDRLKFRLVEIGTILIALKAGSYIGDPWADVLADIETWAPNPLNVINLETLVIFVLALGAWQAMTGTISEIERLEGPPELAQERASALESLTGRFFTGGVILLLASGLARIGIGQVLNMERPPVPGLVLNALVYFLLGLVMLGQVRLVSLRRQWQTQGFRIVDDLGGRWMRYSLILMGAAALVAFLLPTRYTVGILETAQMALGLVMMVLSYVSLAVVTLVGVPLSWLFWLVSKLFGRSPEPPVAPANPPAPAPPPAQPGIYPDWFVVFRSLYFWAVLLGMIYYVARSYLRDHPELVAALQAVRPLRTLHDWWQALWAALGLRLGGWARAARERFPRRLVPGIQRGPASLGPGRFFRLGALSAREKVLYFYLSVLERAGRQGLPRRGGQTPQEYNATLQPHLPEAGDEMAQLTQAFVEARYSRHEVDDKRAGIVKRHWQRVREALQARRRSG